MLLLNQWPMPEWLESVPDADREGARLRTLLSLAALYASEEGTATKLAELLGVGNTAILQARKRGKISAELVIKIELALGRDHFPRELFRPDLFMFESE